MTSRKTVLEFQFETWDRVFFHQGSLRELSGHAPRHLLQVTKCTSGRVLGTHLRTISGTTEKTVSQITFPCSVAHTKDWVDHTDPSHLRWQNHHSRSIHTRHSMACRGPPRCSLGHTCPVRDWCCQLVAWKLCQESWQDCVTTDWQKKKKKEKRKPTSAATSNASRSTTEGQKELAIIPHCLYVSTFHFISEHPAVPSKRIPLLIVSKKSDVTTG